MSVVPPLRMPAEWEPHRATWISWPHHEPDWPGKLGPIPWVYTEIARAIARHEPVEILCASEAVRDEAHRCLKAHAVRSDRVRTHVVPTDRVWLRDSAPTGAIDTHGDVVHLGERDCSLQRRNQKIIEETPSPIMTDEIRERMGEDCVRLAREVGYVGAGTIEWNER